MAMTDRTADYVLVAVPHRATAQWIASELVAMTGLESLVVEDGQEGHDLLVSLGTPPFLVASLALPRRDGASLLRGLRRLEQGRRGRAIALVGSHEERVRAEGLRTELSPLEIVSAPATPEAIRKAIRLLGGHRPALTPPRDAPAPRSPPTVPPTLRAPTLAPAPPVSSVPPTLPTARPSSPPGILPGLEVLPRSSALRLLEATIAELPCGVLVIDRGRVAMANRAFEAMFDLARGELLGALRERMAQRLVAMFVEREEAMRVCASVAMECASLSANLAMRSPVGRLVRWSSTPFDLEGGPVQVLTCFELTAATVAFSASARRPSRGA